MKRGISRTWLALPLVQFIIIVVIIGHHSAYRARNPQPPGGREGLDSTGAAAEVKARLLRHPAARAVQHTNSSLSFAAA